MMKNKIRTHKLYSALLSAVVLALLAVAIALADGSIDAANKWAWGANAGWINLNAANGGVTVFSDHLEGYAWGENVGWIRLGSYTGGGTHIYTNADQNTYGVNNDGMGNLSGYAWGANIGWINFDPNDSQVWVDPVTGDFDGYAWSENVGWISFQGTAQDATAYKTNSNWRGDLLATYENNVAAIITTHRPGPASSAGMDIANISFLNQAGDGIIFGHNNAVFHGGVTDNLDSSAAGKRWARIWQLDVNDEGGGGGNVTLTFAISDAGGKAGAADFSSGGIYFLLGRAAGSTGDFTDVSYDSWSVSGDSITFVVNASDLGSEFTVGASLDSPTAVSLQSISATSQSDGMVALVVGVLLLMLGSLWLWRRVNG